MKLIKNLPNAVTCCNLLAGAAAVMMASEGHFRYALLLIIAGAVFDFLDGLTARALKVQSPIGKELDSLADCITFGLAPSVMLMQTIRLQTETSNYAWGWWSAVALLMAAFSALRLAKFNTDERQTSSFIGLATPANALFWASLIAAFPSLPSLAQWIPCAMIALMLLSCWLLVAELPFFSLKFKSLSWPDNKVRYIFLIGAIMLIVLAAILGHIWAAGAIIIIWYVVANLAAQL
ncbi:MAG: CDP-alcohol phosphatidyltransferase family protein [Paludibacteraceae bacterium]